MVLLSGDLNSRLERVLSTTTHVDIATAWATGGKHLRLLTDATRRRHQQLSIRAIVGISGRATRPDALEHLLEITGGNLKIVDGANQLFHPKLYVFRRREKGSQHAVAWIGSANFTNAGFGGAPRSNEEIMLEVDRDSEVDALASWFQRRWESYHADRSASEIIERYKGDWERNPPRREFRRITSGSISRRVDLLDEAHCPLTFDGYRQALEKCEEMLGDREWGIFETQHRSYMNAISRRQRLLLSETNWSELDDESQTQLKGGARGADSGWWGLTGRIRASHWPTVRQSQRQIQRILEGVRKAESHEFPDVAVDAVEQLKRIDHVGGGTATLMLTLVRPDRLLSVNTASARGLAKLSGRAHSTLAEPSKYGELLLWLYAQPWYSTPCPDDETAAAIWWSRAALVDAFVYEEKG